MKNFKFIVAFICVIGMLGGCSQKEIKKTETVSNSKQAKKDLNLKKQKDDSASKQVENDSESKQIENDLSSDVQKDPAIEEYVSSLELTNPTQIDVNETTASLIADFSDPKVAAAVSDYIFAGKVEEYLGVIQPKPQEMSIPTSVYKIKVQSNIKGELKDEVIVKFWGGIDLDGRYTAPENISPPEVGKTYVFCTQTKSDGGLEMLDMDGFIELASSAAQSTYSLLSENTIENDEVYLKYVEGNKNPQMPEIYAGEKSEERKISRLFDAGK